MIACVNVGSKINGWNVQLEVCQFGGRVAFLDLEVYKNDTDWHTTLFFKSSDVHAYLSPSSEHPARTFAAIPRGVACRVRRACSELVEFRYKARVFKRFLAQRGYYKDKVDKEFMDISHVPYAKLLVKKAPKEMDLTFAPFVYQYEHDNFVEHSLRIAADAATARLPNTPLAFSLPQPVVFTVGLSVQQLLVKSSIDLEEPPPRGCHPCADPDCPFHCFLQLTDKIENWDNGRSFQIKKHINCSTRHVIYAWSCTCGLQGVGECASPKERIPKYIRAITNKSLRLESFSCAIERHFAEHHSSMDEVMLCFVDCLSTKQRSKPALIPTLRKRVENRWIHTSKPGLIISNPTRPLPSYIEYLHML